LNGDFKNVLKTIIFLLQMGTRRYVQNVFWAIQILTTLFSSTVPNFVVFFQLIGQEI